MTATAEPDITQPLLGAAERDRFRHVTSDYGLMIALGMRGMNVYQGTFDHTAYLKRRRRNRAARLSRRRNRNK